MNYWVVFLITVPLGVFVFGRTLEIAYGADAVVWSSLLSDFFGLNALESYNITWWVNRLFLVLWLLFPLLYWSMNSKFVSIWMLILLYYNPGSILYPLNFFASGISTWMISFALGIYLAVNGSALNNILNKINPYVVLVVLCVLALAFLYMRNNCVFYCFLGVKGDPFIVIFLSLAVVCLCRLTNRNFSILAFVGKHSMNMYLMHTFIFGYFFHDFIYGFKKPILIFAVLFFISLLLSIIVELMKNRLKFYQLQQKVISFLG
jgi:membrane-bound acyltransferase YfiQ involved in biofilm formation